MAYQVNWGSHHTIFLFVCLNLLVSHVSSEEPNSELNRPSDFTTMEKPPAAANLSDRMKIVFASFGDPLFAHGINIMKYVSPIIIIFGVVGNLLAFYIVTRKKNARISCSAYMAALAITDTGSLLTLGILWITIINGTMWTVPWCVAWVYIVFLNTAGSGFLLVGVTFDRFFAVCYPLKARAWSTPKRARIISACILLGVAIFYIPMAIMSNVVDGNVCVAFGYETTANTVLANINLMALPIIPFFLLLFMNVRIFLAVKKSDKFEGRTGKAATEQDSADMRKRNRNLTIMLFAVSVAYLIIILPVSVRVVAYSFIDQYASPHSYAIFVFLYALINQILFLNNTVNFYLYVLTGPSFRKDLRQLARRIGACCCKYNKDYALAMSSSSSSSEPKNKTLHTHAPLVHGNNANDLR